MTPDKRVEEKVKEFVENYYSEGSEGGIVFSTGFNGQLIEDWLRTTLTQDHQAGIDEAVEKIPRKVTQPGNESWSPQVLMYYEGYNQALDDTLTIINSIFKE